MIFHASWKSIISYRTGGWRRRLRDPDALRGFVFFNSTRRETSKLSFGFDFFQARGMFVFEAWHRNNPV